MPDDQSLINKVDALNKSKSNSAEVEDTTDELALQEVYETAKVLRNTSTARNLTWCFSN